MRMFIGLDAVSKKDTTVHKGNFLECCRWALERAHETNRPIKVVYARPEIKAAKVIAEATNEGLRHVHAGTLIPLKKLKRLL